MEFIDVVNEQDEVIGRASKQDIYDKLLLHRIVHIFVFNDRGEMALQLQGRLKKFCPLHWVTAATGHVRSGESGEDAALREMEEEIGITMPIEFQYKNLYECIGQKELKKFLIVFKAIYNGPFNINPIEVERVEYFSLEKIQQMIASGEKFHPELLFLLRKHFSIKC